MGLEIGRFQLLDGNPGVLRDAITGNNYHFKDKLEAVRMMNLINDLMVLTEAMQAEIDSLIEDSIQESPSLPSPSLLPGMEY